MKARETSTEFFGKRGISWHGSIVTLVDEGGKEQRYTVHDIMHSDSKQDGFAVLSIVELLLRMVKRTWPHVTECLLQSDNASCYTCKLLVCT